MAKKQEVKLEVLDIKVLPIKIVGVSPFISNKFSDQALAKMENKQRGITTQKSKREPKEEEVESYVHRTNKGDVGYPVAAFYNGMIEVAPYLEGMNKKLVGGSIKVLPDDGSLIEITYSNMEPKRDAVKLNMSASNVIYRPMFDGWGAELKVQFNAALVSPQQIVNLINLAGFQRGIGAMRPGSPKKPGSMGMYKVK